MTAAPFYVSTPLAQCAGKHPFESFGLAKSVAKRRPYPLEVYRCPHCRAWHLGRPASRKGTGKPGKGRDGRSGA